MASRSSHNKNNAGVKRILQEARELAMDPSTDYHAAPLEDDIFEWHCTMRGPSGTEYEGGLYHFRIQLPSEYPFRPPSIMMLTPNGRFELNTKICISFTNYHEELWQPAWGVRTAIIGLQGFFPLKGEAAVGVGAMECSTAERRRLAGLSRDWMCPRCEKPNIELLSDPGCSDDVSKETSTNDTTECIQAQNLTVTEESSKEGQTGTIVPEDQVQEQRLPRPDDAPDRISLQPPPVTEQHQEIRSRPVRPPLLLDGAIAQ
ncbi:hypothetical protein Clacol_006462 [Clathrus columnatus]|uniref:UBC core domain-containing protein n=1 Tax=Clathrus columnatus TaxID=1419009 RepID=A0AAV5AGX8_9AGAM|nr:hypothetical protein Clacol_006462 [Clathrus columnatus]